MSAVAETKTIYLVGDEFIPKSVRALYPDMEPLALAHYWQAACRSVDHQVFGLNGRAFPITAVIVPVNTEEYAEVAA